MKSSADHFWDIGKIILTFLLTGVIGSCLAEAFKEKGESDARIAAITQGAISARVEQGKAQMSAYLQASTLLEQRFLMAKRILDYNFTDAEHNEQRKSYDHIVEEWNSKQTELSALILLYFNKDVHDKFAQIASDISDLHYNVRDDSAEYCTLTKNKANGVALLDRHKTITRVEDDKAKANKSLEDFEESAVTIMKSNYDASQNVLEESAQNQSIWQVIGNFFR